MSKKKRKVSLNGVKYITDEGVIHIDKQVHTLHDLIDLAYYYKPNKKYKINLKKLYEIRHSLIDLNEMVGLENVKTNVVKQILYFIQDLHHDNDEMMHIVIQGSPGVGKTMLGNILGQIYYDLDIIKQPFYNNFNNDNYVKFRCVKRSDLIGKYLGWTAQKTQDVIDSCLGGVMFIDEAYSLGNSNNSDSFSKECIDTINQNLTERKGQFLCIIAGYEKDLNECFFNYNAGLKRRFPFVYTIKPYTSFELKQIFEKLISQKKDNWNMIDIKDTDSNMFFRKNEKLFINMAGDMETLLFYTKLAHSKRIFCKHHSLTRRLNMMDLENGLISMQEHRNSI